MKKTIVLLSSLALISLTSVAQDKKKVDGKQTTEKSVQAVVPPAAPNAAPVRPAAAPAPQAAATPAQNADLSIKFNEDEHNFGNVPEGPSASFDFEFKNIGKVPIIFSDVHGSCGCTVPTWPKEPILPGKKNKITVTYSTQGRVGQINKTVTVTSNIGTKMLKISGNVDKAADAPATAPDVKQPAH